MMLPDQQLLRIPGPTPIPPSVQSAMCKPVIGHRGQETKDLIKGIKPRLKPIFGTEQDVFIFTGSGTLALETAVVNTTKPGEEAFVIVTGSFGDRFAKICEAHGIHLHRYDVTWGEALNPEKVKEILNESPGIRTVFSTYCETSTGVLNPIRELAAVVHSNSDALLVVDGVSCIGGVPGNMDEWNIDILITGSQKAMMLPPGLSFLAASKQAWKVIEENDHARFYLDIRKYRDYLNDNATPFTPAVSLLFGLEQALTLLETEGLENVYSRHQLLKEMTRSAFRALHIPLLAADDAASPTVTAVKPDSFQAEDLRKILRQSFQLTIAGGQNQLKNKIFRIGHMGYCSPGDVLQTISIIEAAIYKTGAAIELGTGTKAAQETLLKHY